MAWTRLRLYKVAKLCEMGPFDVNKLVWQPIQLIKNNNDLTGS